MRRERGAVLLVALAVLSALVGTMAVIASNQRVAIKAQINRGQEVRARLAAEAGIQRALAELQLYVDAGQVSTATLADDWAILGTEGGEKFVLQANSYRMQIVDGSSLININTASQEQLERMPLTSEQIDSLLDWRSAELEARPEGAKDEYYNSLEVPYNAKLRRFDSLDELILVKGFTARAVFEPQEDVEFGSFLVTGPNGEIPAIADVSVIDSRSSNVGADGQAKLNVNTASAQQMVQRGIPNNIATAIVQRRNTQGTFTQLGDVLRVQGVNAQNAAAIVDNLWISGATTVEGRINVNTASELVLSTLPGMEPDVAAAIVGRQNTAVQSLSELLSIPGFGLEVLQQTVDRLTTGTQVFLVRVIGVAGDTQVALQATLVIDAEGPNVLKIERMPFANMWERWGWEQETTSETVISEN
ncbi:MAG: helix-hairpin-helix domain-containing protein [Fimbriimonadaceae bacterium]